LRTEQVSGLIGDAYQAGLSPDRWRVFLDRTASAFDSDLGVIVLADRRDPATSFVASGGMSPAVSHAFQDSWAESEDDYWWCQIRDAPAGRVFLGRYVLDPDLMRASDLHERLGVPCHPADFLGGAVASSERAGAWFSLMRSDTRPGFEPEDGELLRDTLFSHVARGLLLNLDLQPLLAQNLMLTAIVERAPYGLIMFDGKARPTLVNGKANELLGDGGRLRLLHGRLTVQQAQLQASLDRGLAQALQIARGAILPAPPPVMIPSDGGRGPVRVAFVPMGTAGGDPLTGGAVGCLAMLHGSNSPPANFSATMISLFGLTPAEVRLCELLFEGHTLSEAAERCQISRNTAKTHLGRIFSKTGVHSQIGLLHLLAIRPGGRPLNDPAQPQPATTGPAAAPGSGPPVGEP
jgi:DNA-binding CsgD family transcriptional regulator/PAS domain-containing protein